MEMIELGQVRRLLIAHRDRLVRFGYDYFEAFCERHHTELVVINGEAMPPEQELVRDLIAIVTVFSVDGRTLHVPKLGAVNMTEALRFQGKIMSATISYRAAGWWFVAIAVEVECEMPPHHGGTVGIDLGIKTLATLSDGEKFENQKHYRRNLGRIKGLSHKVEGSQNWWKNAKKLARAHYRFACQREDTLHKMTTHVAQTYALIGLEDLNAKGMLANHCLAQAVSDASFFEVKRQVLYKAEQYGDMCSW